MDKLQTLMERIDKNKDKISENDYLLMMNDLKDLYDYIELLLKCKKTMEELRELEQVFSDELEND